MENAMTSASASRVTRSRRNLQLAVLLFASCLAVVTVLRAQEPAAPARGQEATEGKEGTESAGAKKSTAVPAAPTQDEQDKAEPPANPDRKPGVVGSTPGRFEPTEKVRADFDVSFPVDI
jgi:hypothetical protein